MNGITNVEDGDVYEYKIGQSRVADHRNKNQVKAKPFESTFQRFCLERNLDASNITQTELQYLFPEGTIRYTNCESSIFKKVEGDGWKEVLENLLHEMEIPNIIYPADGEIDQMVECVPVFVRHQCSKLVKCFTEIFDRVNFHDHTDEETRASCKILAAELGKAVESSRSNFLIYSVLTKLQNCVINNCSEKGESSISHVICTAFWNSLIENVTYNPEGDGQYRLELTKNGERKLQSTYHCDVKPQQRFANGKEELSIIPEFVMEKIITAIPDGICEMKSSLYGSSRSLSRRIFIMEIKTADITAMGKLSISETPAETVKTGTKLKDISGSTSGTGETECEMKTSGTGSSGTKTNGTKTNGTKTSGTKTNGTKTNGTKLCETSIRESIKTQHFLSLLNSLRVTYGPDGLCYDIKPYAVGFYIVMNKVYVSVLKVKSDLLSLSDALRFQFIYGRGALHYTEMAQKEEMMKRYFDLHVSDYFNLFDSSHFKALMLFLQLLVYGNIKHVLL